MDLNDPTVAAIVHSQKIARQIGANQVAIEVHGWAIKHALQLQPAALKELMDIVCKDAE